MKKLLFLLFAAIPALAQYNPPAVTATALYQYASAPATCTVGQVYVLISTFAPYYCSAANTWTAFGGGGGGISYPAGTGIVAVASGTAWGTTYNASNVIPANFLAAIPLTGLATQAANTILQNATGGSASPTAVAMPTCTTGADLYNTSTHTWSCVSTGGGGSTETHTGSSSAELDFTTCLAGGLNLYQIQIINLQTSASTSVNIQFSTNGGSTWDTGANYEVASSYATAGNGTGGSGSGTGLNGIPLRTVASDTSGHYPIAGSLYLYAPTSTAYKEVTGMLFSRNNGDPSGPTSIFISGDYTPSSTVNAFRVLPGSGTLNGTVSCYAVPN